MSTVISGSHSSTFFTTRPPTEGLGNRTFDWRLLLIGGNVCTVHTLHKCYYFILAYLLFRGWKYA